MCRIRFYTNALYRMKSNQIYLSAYTLSLQLQHRGPIPRIHFIFTNELYVCVRGWMRVCVHALEIM